MGGRSGAARLGARVGGRGRGSYIVGSLKAIFCAMKLQVGDSIEITELARHARYSLKKAK